MTANQGQTPPAPPGARRYCGECALARLCLPGNLDARDVARLDEIVLRRRPLQRDEHLYVAGTRLHAIYVVRAGANDIYGVEPGARNVEMLVSLKRPSPEYDFVQAGNIPCIEITG